MGKPVLSRIDDKLVRFYKDLPILNTPPERIRSNILMLLGDGPLRVELGMKGRKYVENNHDDVAVARQLLDLYRRL